jgi:aryl-alcohol dehydrogenase-like predicted oxidoreductase
VVVGRAIKNQRDKIVLATKVRFPQGSTPNEAGLSRFHIMQAVENSLRRLATDYIDLYYMHCWDNLTPIEESLRAFEDLVTAGKIRYLGVSNFKAWQLMKALSVSDAHGWNRFVVAQYQYSLIKRDIENEFSDLCLSEGVGLTPWGPLGGGFLSGKYKRDQKPSTATEGRIGVMDDEPEEAWHRRNTERNWQVIEVMGQIAEARGATYSQIAIAWLRAQPTVSSVIIGTRTMAQLEDNLGAAELDLTADELAQLNKVSALPEGYPYYFMQTYGQRKANH